jgi:integrase
MCEKFTDGDWIEAKDQSDAGIRLVQTGNIGIAEYLDKPNNKKWISEETFERLHCEEVYPNDILISRLPEPAGRACIMPNLGTKMITAVDCTIVRPSKDVSANFLLQYLSSQSYFDEVNTCLAGGTRQRISRGNLAGFDVPIPLDKTEQDVIGNFLCTLDNLITLHQRKPYSHIQRRCNMLNEAQRTDKFCEYYAKWITVYKKGAIRQVTMDKYLMTQKWLEKLIPDLKICDLNRIAYQQLLNDYAEYHERQTTMDFHHQLKGAVLDAVDEGLIDRDPTRKAIIKGKAPSTKKIKYLNQFELHTLLASLELKDEVNWDYFILLVAKTGMRFSEALALTPKDFDFYHQTLSISKTWDYKGAGGFQPTKNKSSVRKIQIDWQSVIRFSELVKGLPDDQPIFVDGKVYNSTVNDVLSRHCERCNIPVISIHGLRHTHASLLLFTGVSIASVARRLGHSSMTTTQKTYLHIIQELENKDIDLVMRSLSGLN